MSQISKLVTATAITLYIKGHGTFTLARSHKYADQLLEALKEGDVQKILQIRDMAQKAHDYMQGKVRIEDGEVYYDGERLTDALADRIIQLMSEGQDASGMIKFLENLMQNPSYRSRSELYLFLEACGDLPITEDGRFIAYKWVRNDYMDVHSGTFDNSVGQKPSMPRGKVDDDRSRTCSAGLHVCSNKYYKFGERLMLVAVNPRDVVSVPLDYDNGKMRVCEYEVVEEVEAGEYRQFSSAHYTVNEDEHDSEDYDDSDDDYDGDDYQGCRCNEDDHY